MLNAIRTHLGAKRANPRTIAILGLIMVVAGAVTLVTATAYPLTMAIAGLLILAGALEIVANPTSSWRTDS